MTDLVVGVTKEYEVPQGFQLAVQEWARGFGRKAHMAFTPYPPGTPTEEVGCFTVFLERKSDDPVMRLYQEGKIERKPYEGVPLQVWNKEQQRYEPLRLEDYGPSGIVELLRKGDTWSGRGEYKDMMTAARAAIKSTELARRELRKEVGETARETAWLHRRTGLKIPYITTGMDLGSKSENEAVTTIVAANADKEQ